MTKSQSALRFSRNRDIGPNKLLSKKRCVRSFIDANVASLCLDETFIYPLARACVYMSREKFVWIIRPSLSLISVSSFSFRSSSDGRSHSMKEPPLSAPSLAFLSSRNKSYVFAYKRPFNITTLDLPPQTVHLRVREAERAKLPACSADICLPATPRPDDTSVPRFSLI